MKPSSSYRVGDFGFLLGIFGSTRSPARSARLVRCFGAAQGLAGKTMEFLGYKCRCAHRRRCLLLSLAPWASRRQFLLHTPGSRRHGWPTPVSPSSTRRPWSPPASSWWRACRRLRICPIALQVVMFFGATTAFFAATVGLVQNDIKRVRDSPIRPARSSATCSWPWGQGPIRSASYHLFTHEPSFKALLFLGAGSVIHAMHHEQDIRRKAAASPPHQVHLRDDGIGHAALTASPAVPPHRLRRLSLEGRDHRGPYAAHGAWVPTPSS